MGQSYTAQRFVLQVGGFKKSPEMVDNYEVSSALTMKPRQRVFMSLTGVVPAMIGVPVLMSTWAPRAAVAAWLGAYVLVSVTAWVLLLRGSTRVEHWWSATVGLIFGLIPVSAHVFDSGTKSFWIAAMVCFGVITFEVSTLPHLGDFEWRTGPALMGAMTSGIAFLEAGPATLPIIPVLLAILRNGDELRSTKKSLEESFAAAESQFEQARDLARNDALTGLLNRRGLVAEIDEISSAGDYMLLMVDADRFKAVNDTHGHAAGDSVIRTIGQTLADRLGDRWTLGRLGGDEFVAVAPVGTVVARGTCDPIQCTVSLYGIDSKLSVAVSGGLVASHQGEDPDRLLSKAGYAMRIAKGEGGGLATFDDDLAVRFDRMLEFTGRELDPASFLAVFQPIVDTRATIIGSEVLCRWQRDDGTILTPDQFLPLLAESGQMGLLNETMIRRGVEFAARFGDAEGAPFVSVNIGSAHLTDERLVPLIIELLGQHDVAPQRLMIEITENDLLGQDSAWQRNAQRLLRLGVMLAIDDFGSGYSNIDRLNQLPVSHLKFDRSLTTSVGGPLGSVARGVVDFAAKTQIGIIAEGIETEEEFLAMEAIGVELFQGYFFGRPADADVVEAAIHAGVDPTLVPASFHDAPTSAPAPKP